MSSFKAERINIQVQIANLKLFSLGSTERPNFHGRRRRRRPASSEASSRSKLTAFISFFKQLTLADRASPPCSSSSQLIITGSCPSEQSRTPSHHAKQPRSVNGCAFCSPYESGSQCSQWKEVQFAVHHPVSNRTNTA